jgi:hypothetical protein
VWITLPRHSGLAKINDQSKGARVRGQPLDSFDFPRVDLVKLDAEGFEGQVLEGARSTIDRCRPVIILENDVSDKRAIETVELLHSLSYSLYVPCLAFRSGDSYEIVDEYGIGRRGMEACRLLYCPMLPVFRLSYAKRLNILAVPEERVSGCSFLSQELPERSPIGL